MIQINQKDCPDQEICFYDVVIVGAGFAGLKASLALKAEGKKILLLEAQDRVGGRCKAGKISGQTVDFGGQWIGAHHRLFREEAQKAGIKLYPQYEKGKSLLSFNGKARRFNWIPPFSPFALMEILTFIFLWGRDMKCLPKGKPWQAKQALKWDALSFEGWLLSHAKTKQARDFARAVISGLFCVEPSEISYLFFLEAMRQGRGMKVMMATSGGAQQDKVLGGAWRVAKKMADQLEEALRLNSPVQKIIQKDHAVQIITASGESYRAKHVIIAVPPPLVEKMVFEPPLSSRKRGLFKHMPMGNVMKIHISYEKPFWRARKLSGEAIGIGLHLGTVYDQTPQDEKIGILVGVIEGKHALALSNMSYEARRQIVIEDLVHYFGEEALHPLEYVDYDWTQDKWAEGGYAACMGTGTMGVYGPVLGMPDGRIHWAGTETATEWTGYFEGALQSGLRAAKEILTKDFS